MPTSVGNSRASKELSVFVELNTRHDSRYVVSLEWDRDTGKTQIVDADSGSSSMLAFPVAAENAGDAFRHPFRYAPWASPITDVTTRSLQLEAADGLGPRPPAVTFAGTEHLGARTGAPAAGPPGILGVRRLPQLRRPVEGAAL